MGAHHSGHFTANYKNCIALDNWLGKHPQNNIITRLYHKVYDKSDCLGIVLAHNRHQQDGHDGHKSTIPNPMSYVPPPIKNVDTTNSYGDEGGAVFVYVLIAGIAFVGFMWYEGSF